MTTDSKVTEMQINNDSQSRKRFFSIVLLSMSVLLFVGCYQQGKKRELPPPLVYVAQAQKQDVRMYADYTGKTKACESVSIPARVSGFLEKMTFSPGQIVEKGDPLFVIEQTPYQANVEQAEAELATGNSELEYTKAEYERAVTLHESNNTMTLEELQERLRNYQQAQAAIKSAEAALVEAKLQLSYTEICAPISGKISRNMIDIGNLVGEPASGRTPLATIENMDPIYVYFEISDSDFYRMTELYGTPRRSNQDIASENGKNSAWPFAIQLMQQEDDDATTSLSDQYPFEGIVNYIDNTINPTVGAITVRGEIQNHEFKIYPGTVCRVKIPTKTLKDATVVYERAIGSDFNHHYMFVVNKENKVERRMVEKGPAVDHEFCVVFGDINPDETYVVEGLQKVRINETVDAKPYEPKKAGSAPKNSEPKKPAMKLEHPGNSVFTPQPDVDEEKAFESA